MSEKERIPYKSPLDLQKDMINELKELAKIYSEQKKLFPDFQERIKKLEQEIIPDREAWDKISNIQENLDSVNCQISELKKWFKQEKDILQKATEESINILSRRIEKIKILLLSDIHLKKLAWSFFSYGFAHSCNIYHAELEPNFEKDPDFKEWFKNHWKTFSGEKYYAYFDETEYSWDNNYDIGLKPESAPQDESILDCMTNVEFETYLHNIRKTRIGIAIAELKGLILRERRLEKKELIQEFLQDLHKDWRGMTWDELLNYVEELGEKWEEKKK